MMKRGQEPPAAEKIKKNQLFKLLTRFSFMVVLYGLLINTAVWGIGLSLNVDIIFNFFSFWGWGLLFYIWKEEVPEWYKSLKQNKKSFTEDLSDVYDEIEKELEEEEKNED